jgi:hypothetical protein
MEEWGIADIARRVLLLGRATRAWGHPKFGVLLAAADAIVKTV